MIFVHEGSGTLYTMYGELNFKYGDYIIIPRGTVYKINFDNDKNRLLYIESFSPIFTPSRYRNQFGQLLEHSPFCERDIVRPKNLKTHDEQGEFDIYIKKKGMMYPYVYANHPFDVAGWDVERKFIKRFAYLLHPELYLDRYRTRIVDDKVRAYSGEIVGETHSGSTTRKYHW